MEHRSDAAPRFTPTGFFVMRTPLLPFRVMLEWSAGRPAPESTSGEVVERVGERDRAALVQRLRSIVASPQIVEALFIASPTTHAELHRWRTANSDDPKLERTLVRYLQRMASRATPFGLFAGYSLGVVGEKTRLGISPAADYRRHSRLDNDYLCALANHLAAQHVLRAALPLRPNSSLYYLGGRWRYVQTVFRDMMRLDRLVALESDVFLDAVIARARGGASVEDLVSQVLAVGDDGEITRDEATVYVTELVDQQVLETEMAPLVTGQEALADMIQKLRSLDLSEYDTIAATLESVETQLAEIDRQPLGIAIESYQAIQTVLAGLGVAPDPSRLIQVDLTKPSPGLVCGADVVADLSDAVGLLHRISRPLGEDALSRFKDKFRARYEQREIALIEALDEEAGVGFERSTAGAAENPPLLRGLPLYENGAVAQVPWTNRDAFLLSKLDLLRAEGGRELRLGDSDIERLTSHQLRPLPDAFSVFAVLGVACPERPDERGVLLRHVLGPSGVNIMGRFCHGDQELTRWVRKQIVLEEALRPDVIFAEIVHLPHGRLANVLTRPVLRQFEIVYLGRSGVGEANRIAISDLFVSVTDDRVVLRSASLGREVVPRMTNMHNVRGGHGIYRFLCALQSQGVTSWLGWSWGVLDSLNFLPRVTYGRVVLERARWCLDRDTLARLVRGTSREQFTAVQQWREREDLPRFMTLVEGDNELLVDFDNIMSVETWLHAARKRDRVLVTEQFPQPEGLIAHGPEGRYVQEVILPFVRETASQAPPQGVRAAPLVTRTQRSFPPGTEWMYLKWYAGTATVDVLLTDIVHAFVSRQIDAGAASQWFFVRYGDPDWHLRIRLRGEPARLWSETMPEASRAVEAMSHALPQWKTQVDTYEREIERYGGVLGMDLSEQLFWLDSEAVVQIMKVLPGEAGMDERWRVCVRGCDLLLADVGFTLHDKWELTKAMRDASLGLFRSHRHLKRALGDRFRRERQTLEALWESPRVAGHPLAASLEVLRTRSLQLEPVMHALRLHGQAGRLQTSMRTLASSYLHMHINRMLRSSHRSQELVIYDFLHRLYDSQLARRRGRGGTARVEP